jgi:2-polyprenyl-3-methyl-5-hydroxy-6-metoxy-1,4-benzoquinol methylase
MGRKVNNKSPKSTSFEYGPSHQKDMEKFYWESKVQSVSNHNWNRVQLAEQIVANATEMLGKTNAETTILDVGCSVGCLAIHFSKLGYSTIGIDFDPVAIARAEQLNVIDNGKNAKFILGDVSDTHPQLPPIDIALCFDIFEHLHDDELGSLLQSLRRVLAPNGVVVFHTYPQCYDYIFSYRCKNQKVSFPVLLKPLSYLPAPFFKKAVRIYASLIDIVLILITGKTWRERIKMTGHCNALTVERLTDILARANYDILELQSGFITDQFNPGAKKRFLKHQITHRSIYGMTRPKQ